jgi:hypothetical protein
MNEGQMLPWVALHDLQLTCSCVGWSTCSLSAAYDTTADLALHKAFWMLSVEWVASACIPGACTANCGQRTHFTLCILTVLLT